MVISHMVLALLWILYCVLHSLLADPGFKKRIRQGLGKRFRYYRLAYTLFAFISLLIIVVFQYKMTTIKLFPVPTFLKATGWVIAIAGLLIMIACIKKYFLSLSGLLSLAKESYGAPLMLGGMHRYVRHPLYLGTFLALWGTFLLLPFVSLLISNLIITVYTLIGIRLEEKKLVMEYGKDYIEYKKKVPMLIPFGVKRKIQPVRP